MKGTRSRTTRTTPTSTSTITTATTTTATTTTTTTITLNPIEAGLVDGMIGWWKLDGNFADDVGNHPLTPATDIEGEDTAGGPVGFHTGSTAINPSGTFYGPLGDEEGIDSGAVSVVLLRAVCWWFVLAREWHAMVAVCTPHTHAHTAAHAHCLTPPPLTHAHRTHQVSDTFTSVNTAKGMTMAGWIVAEVGGKGGKLFGFGTGTVLGVWCCCPSQCLDGLYGGNGKKQWTLERNAIGHTPVRCSVIR
jgi:hypothetical protein